MCLVVYLLTNEAIYSDIYYLASGSYEMVCLFSLHLVVGHLAYLFGI